MCPASTCRAGSKGLALALSRYRQQTFDQAAILADIVGHCYRAFRERARATRVLAVRTENLNPDVVVVKAAEDRV